MRFPTVIVDECTQAAETAALVTGPVSASFGVHGGLGDPPLPIGLMGWFPGSTTYMQWRGEDRSMDMLGTELNSRPIETKRTPWSEHRWLSHQTWSEQTKLSRPTGWTGRGSPLGCWVRWASKVPIARGCQQAILIGDQCQLPPTVSWNKLYSECVLHCLKRI